MTADSLSPTFRDPAGSLMLDGDQAIRSIHPEARAAALAFVHSPFYARAVERGDMVPSEVDEGDSGLRLIHPRVAIPTYPWEWTPSQWVAAAELTLSLCEQGLQDGWILKDATPLNILFIGSRPVLVDVLSFERRDPAASIWLAYAQYTRSFLLPLVMARLAGWPLELTIFKRDGYEPAELYNALSWSQRASPAALWHISLPAWLERRKGADQTASRASATRSGDPELTAHILTRMLANLRKSTRAALPKDSASEWADYQATRTHYTSNETDAKKAWVSGVLTRLKPARVLDVGANTGEYSALAARAGAEVIALERDAAAAERLFLRSRAEASTIQARQSIQTIHADLARPTPAAGWDNRESSALLPRLEGKSDLVMLLAVIHHLILMEQIPLSAILALCRRLTRRHLIVEWVPVTDPMFQSLMRGRDSLYGSLAEADLLDACAPGFTLVERFPLENGRTLFLFERR